MPRQRGTPPLPSTTVADEELRACARCGTSASGPAGGMPAGWSLATDPRGLLFHCEGCTRTNVRAIEGKLDEEWWEG